MNIRAAFVADGQPSEPTEPRQGPLDHPSVSAQRLTRVDPFAGDAPDDVPRPAGVPAAGNIVRLVGVHLDRPSAAPAGDVLHWALHEPDFISANRLARVINVELGMDSASVVDAGVVSVRVPADYQGRLPDLIARLEPLSVETDTAAKVVINERTGTVVMGGDVRIGTAAVAHGNLAVRISTRYQVSQPRGLSQGQTTVVPQTDLDVNESEARLVSLDAGATLADVVRALNMLGATPRDIIAVMQALKAAGALRAEIVVL